MVSIRSACCGLRKSTPGCVFGNGDDLLSNGVGSPKLNGFSLAPLWMPSRRLPLARCGSISSNRSRVVCCVCQYRFRCWIGSARWDGGNPRICGFIRQIISRCTQNVWVVGLPLHLLGQSRPHVCQFSRRCPGKKFRGHGHQIVAVRELTATQFYNIYSTIFYQPVVPSVPPGDLHRHPP